MGETMTHHVVMARQIDLKCIAHVGAFSKRLNTLSRILYET